MAFPADAMVITAFWTDTNASLGWSESYYLDTADHTVALVNIASIMALRKKFTCDVYRCTGTRAAIFGSPGDSRISVVNLVGEVDSTLHRPCDPWTALNFRIEAGAAHRGRKFLHGMPQDMFLANRAYDTTSAYNADVNAYITALTSTFAPILGLKTKNPTPPPTYQFLAIDGAVPLKMTERRVGRPFTLLHGRS